MERTEKNLPFDNTPKPLKRQGFSESRFQNGPSFSSQPSTIPATTLNRIPHLWIIVKKTMPFLVKIRFPVLPASQLVTAPLKRLSWRNRSQPDNPAHRFIFKRFVSHGMAPAAGGVANVQEDRPVGALYLLGGPDGGTSADSTGSAPLLKGAGHFENTSIWDDNIPLAGVRRANASQTVSSL